MPVEERTVLNDGEDAFEDGVELRRERGRADRAATPTTPLAELCVGVSELTEQQIAA
jgi:hypothetical protein